MSGPFDLVLLDHEKSLYTQDYELLVNYGVLNKGHYIIGDNIINPGCP